MGNNNWSDKDFSDRQRVRKSTGKSAFTYTDDDMKSVDRSQWQTHPSLNPKGVIRESRDSATHPESLAIMAELDVTGSMRNNPRIIQKNLPSLMGLLLQKKYVEHPQILFGAVGDAKCDQAPLQIGQFESGIEMDNDLGRFLLEGGGGGQGMETYELGIYFAARHTSIDCWEKRKKKGYLILMGDEMPYPYIDAQLVRELIGDKLTENIQTEAIIAEAKEKFHIFMIRPTSTDWGADKRVNDRWIFLLGEDRVIKLEYAETISEVISLIIGLTEGKITLEEGIRDVKELGETNLTAPMIESLAKSLANVPSVKPKSSPKASKKSGSAAETKKQKKPGRI